MRHHGLIDRRGVNESAHTRINQRGFGGLAHCANVVALEMLMPDGVPTGARTARESPFDRRLTVSAVDASSMRIEMAAQLIAVTSV
jgi:hypothetical protein